MIKRNDHHLATCASFVNCLKCRVRRRHGNYKFWAANACAGSCRRDDERTSRQDTAASPFPDNPARSASQEMAWVTRAKAKSLRAERAKALKEHIAEAKQVEREAGVMAVRMSSDSCSRSVITEKCIPFDVHASHSDVVELGGYVGCTKCGRIASSAHSGNGLAKECRQYCPAGSKGSTQRMLKGKHPLASAGTTWPDGSVDPKPRRLRRQGG